MTGYKVLNMLNAHALCVLPAVHTLIFSCYITLWNVRYTTDAVDHFHNFQFSHSFEFRGDALPNIQPTIFFKICL